MPDALVPLLRELVGIDSTSSRSNLPIIDVLERRLAGLGFACERQRYLDEAGVEKANLIGRLGQGVPELALLGHSDCVPFDPSWREALTLTERDGRFYGRGSCDTKAFVACALIAAEAVKARLTRPVMLVFTADEELGCFGAKKMVEANTVRPRRAIIGEPTSLRPIRANKGYCLAEVEVHGQEGHSAYPDTGASAIFRASRLLSRLERYAQVELRQVGDPAFVPPYATVNVGMVAGGKAKNIIPGSCRFTLEWRPLPTQANDEVLRALQGLLDTCIAEEPGFRATITPLRMDRGFDTRDGEDVVQFLSAQTGLQPDTAAFGTEGPQLQQLGAVPVVFGPGDITVAHQTGEYVPREDLFRAEQILEAALLHFAG